MAIDIRRHTLCLTTDPHTPPTPPTTSCHIGFPINFDCFEAINSNPANGGGRLSPSPFSLYYLRLHCSVVRLPPPLYPSPPRAWRSTPGIDFRPLPASLSLPPLTPAFTPAAYGQPCVKHLQLCVGLGKSVF